MIKVRFTPTKLLRLAFALVLTFSLVATFIPESASAAPAESYGCSQYYKVRRGDTLSQIAAWYGVNYHNLAYANGIHNPNHIYYGQKLCIPDRGYGGYSSGYGHQANYSSQHNSYQSHSGYGQGHGRGHGYGHQKSYYPKVHYHGHNNRRYQCSYNH